MSDISDVVIPFAALFALVAVVLVAVVLALKAVARVRPALRHETDIVALGLSTGTGVRSAIRHGTDIRLPYKKYKEIYPSSSLTYKEYKQLQARDAFRTAVPSKQHHRMVR